MKNLLPLLGLSIVIAIVAGIFGYSIGSQSSSSAIQNGISQIGQNENSKLNLSAQPVGPSGLISQQEAVAKGSVLTVNDKTITIEGANGTQGTFTFAAKSVVYPLLSSASAHLVATFDKGIITPGQHVALTLSLVGTTYQVISVSLLQ